ncbi:MULTISPECIES: dimethylarginine dimethylaminohydrolase family protein [Peribacillus]|jgi:dimethylargininase|uniref:Arginine deiminase-related protein n=1 Tax=Peribacillus frigoritolerans TaxID=450367 RepID=A0AAJ1QNX0_9BACI|nr:arginine deiminase-related protein [Peribacillus frigoritolerans]PCD08994.1 N(G),N(G)-dimethylarginine dimethylaminohydrolase [Peribacillus simplex]MCM3167442.1 arginine deiminase-related protein [Peribacillus frigoritolerans]MCP1494456.1 dimethylargininase [Peribacillus frigoritolerans]MCR8870186.1 arginine deiminase-related protein [Peribacillus frigoritolerans]MCU6603602.1 arginine deiminase-related protein [Peribacillus frigoritolerans]
MFNHAIVRKIGKSFVNGLTTSDLGNPNYEKALVQHEAYVEALKQCGVKVTVLESDERYPDSTFVEDTAVLTPKCALVTNPGAESRNGEINEMKEVLKDFYDTIEYIQSPGMLDGGDVMQVEDHFYVGLSTRTNEAGALQFKDIMGKYGYGTTIIPLKKFFHLKTGVNYLGDNNLLVAGEFINHEAFSSFNQIIVKEEEEYSGNCVRMNDCVIVPKGFEGTKKKIEELGYTVIEVEMTEFQKQDGGLSCLSLRF